MHSFKDLLKLFEERFNTRHFPDHTPGLYNAAQYVLDLGGKRVRPVCVLMGNELFTELNEDAFHVATAIELFHNYTLIHDDIMDKAPLRRGSETVHARFGESTAILAGDVMCTQAYEYLNKVRTEYLQKIIHLFNKTSKEVCEGQQMDMDFEKMEMVNFGEYLQMVTLKTAVLLAASLQLGALLGGAGEGNQQCLYAFGKNLGIAFQVQDDYLDAFGDPGKFGKQLGGDIQANKKTFLMIHAMEKAGVAALKELKKLMNFEGVDKVNRVLQIFKDCKVDEWARSLKDHYLQKALKHLDDTAVISERKKPLTALATFLLTREN